MILDFKVSHLKKWHQPTNSNQALIHFIKQAQNNAGFSNLELVKRMGFRNTNKAMRRLHHFERSGQLAPIYRQKIIQVLGLNKADIEQIEQQHSDHQWLQLALFIRHFNQIWSHRKMIVRHPDYANVSFPGLYLSVAYLQVPNYNLGLLLQHYMNGDWMESSVCCGDFHIVGAGGSPLSGRNTCHGFCGQCQNQKHYTTAQFGTLLKAHKAIKPVCEQRLTDKTMTDLLRDFSLLID
ncbi:hypothetical protein GCM10011365_22400 [Marinicella pacifica]|uniref:Uncharacterized protein n=1 Tax=Marinicella pacifica TaxID=1171543 RepID=A0A917CWG6_9GAMM|nr:hypothetical protein [Marinicella pacifica]GGG00681.1 hypothetical protein GCM10011365_22400 [Marinicella pacifica]